MSDQKGSDSPSYIQRYASLLGLGSIDASFPTLRDNEGKLKAEQHFLLEMLEQLRWLEKTYANDLARIEEIQLCSSLIEELLGSENWQAPISEANSFFSLYLGYLFGRMTLPSHDRYHEARNAGLKQFQADAKRHEGAVSNAEASKEATAERMAEGKQIWDELIKAGRSEHGLPQLVQSRLAARGVLVSVDTVTRWARKEGWRNKTKKRTR